MPKRHPDIRNSRRGFPLRLRLSKNDPVEYDGGKESVKGNRQGSLSRSMTRRSDQNCKIKLQQMILQFCSQLVEKVQPDFFDKLGRLCGLPRRRPAVFMDRFSVPVRKLYGCGALGEPAHIPKKKLTAARRFRRAAVTVIFR